MRYAIRFAVAICCVVALQALPAEARRVALVIGNAEYTGEGVRPLRNPVNDAVAVAEAFQKLKFDKVILMKDVAYDGFIAALGELARDSAGADLGVFYFAGHGNPAGSGNFLFPTDVKATDTASSAVDLDRVLAAVAQVKELALLIVDTHHATPFVPELRIRKETSKTRGISKVESKVEPGAEVLVVYSGKPGAVVSDGTDRHSPFTEALVKHVMTPGLEVRLLLGHVRDDVIAATGGDQHPWVYGTLGAQAFYLGPPTR